MRKILDFTLINCDSLKEIFERGISAYAFDRLVFGGISAIWLKFYDGKVLKISAKATDTIGWDEVGTLVLEKISKTENTPQMQILPKAWESIKEIKKLVVGDDDFLAESGLKIENAAGDILIVLCSENFYQIEIAAPFFVGKFLPEYNFIDYKEVILN